MNNHKNKRRRRFRMRPSTVYARLKPQLQKVAEKEQEVGELEERLVAEFSYISRPSMG